ncbi:hypothetical protein [uncultured Psychroserpens sp.]|uniref:hypothetical protein n=1 Tax=uncultured Psychroserpens sp. TaxID=255436 RepID=UPI00261FA981|nr:hypothetical protein [uncultured Psychroserpens sp.]
MKLKRLIFTILCIFTISFGFSQKQKNFKEKQYLILKNGKYLTQENDPTVFLKVKIKNGKKLEKTEVLISKNDTIYKYKEVDDYIVKPFLQSDFTGLTTSKFKGDFKIEKKKLVFYPWKFSAEKDSTLNQELSENSYYLDIPDRTVLKVKFRSCQFGALTLPVKIYLSSKADSLVNNIQTDVNLNFMIGHKWGHKKYSQLPNEKEGTSYENAWSINFLVGMSKIDLKKNNTTPDLTEDISVPAISTGFAFGYQYRKIGVYIASGIDNPLSKYGKDWDFKNQLWLGFGLGLGL